MRSITLGSLVAITSALAMAAPAAAAPPANDAFSHAQVVTVGESYTGSVLEATRELGEPPHAGLGPHHSVWFRYRAAHSSRTTIDTGTSDFDTTLAVYTGERLDDLTHVASDDDSSPSGNLGSTVRFNARRGRTYLIAVDSYSSDAGAGNYALWISDGGIRGKGIELAVDEDQSLDSVSSRGLRVNITARRLARVRLALRVGRHTARLLGLDSRVIGRTSGTVGYGESMSADIVLRPRARRALRHWQAVWTTLRLGLPRATVPDRSINRVMLLER